MCWTKLSFVIQLIVLVFKSVFFCFRGQFEYELVLKTDLYTNRHTQWYYFRVQNTVPGVTYRFRIVNMLKRDSLYNYGKLFQDKARHISMITPSFSPWTHSFTPKWTFKPRRFDQTIVPSIISTLTDCYMTLKAKKTFDPMKTLPY